MVQCANGTQAKASSPTYIWLLWSSFLAWLTTHFSRLGNIVWIFFPDAPVDVTAFCSAEVSVPAIPGILTWIQAFQYNAGAQLEVGNYLINLYKAALWDTYCECVPLTGTGADPYSVTVLADGPSFYYKTDETTGIVFADSSGNSRSGTYTEQSGPTADANLHQAGPFAGWYSFGQIGTGCAQTTGAWRANWRTSAVGTFEGWFLDTGTTVGGQQPFAYFAGTNLYANGLSWNRFGDHKFSLPMWGSSFHDTTFVGLADSLWHYLVLSYDGTTMRLYYDGTLAASVVDAVAVAIPGVSTIGFGTNLTASTCGRMSRLAYYDYALSATRVAAHYAAAGAVPFQPPYVPPAPADPTGIPDYPVTTCTTTADLCTAIAQLKALDLSILQQVNWNQSSQSPTGWSPETAATGLTGVGTIAVTDIIGAWVQATVPLKWGRTAETPPRMIPEIGSIQWELNGVPSDRTALHYTSEQIFGAPPATDHIRYNFRPGVVGSIVPLGRLK